ncbi:hypothetical protein C9374_004320 [Naegleria lovaniensis]|uniref:Uncharacterized protein n=1 Tax=Naegleria lovaniensis TaxID=51637 RepID=A0AA88GR49_NAELO|nr:uncharacterized protein C9374_004320 [Naegleria lovaniensis]KAG2383649.1 hypothetical protein C9374_004320 [Naegleria lovaniensis]
MMNRILRTTELTLFSLDDHTLPYFATFLRMQRLFKENNNRLTSDSIYLYEDRQHLCLVSNERASLTFGISTSQPCAVLQLTNPSLWLMSSSSPSVTTTSIEDVATIHNGDIDQEAKPLQPSKPFMLSFSDPTPNIFGATPSTTDNFSFASTVVSKKDKDDMNEQQSLIPLHETLEFQTSDDSEVVNSIPTTSTAISSDDQGLNPPMGTSLFNTSSSNTGFSSKSTTPEAHLSKISLIVFTPSRDTFSLSRILRVLTVLDHVLILTANGGTVVFTNESVKNVVLINSTTNESLLNDLQTLRKYCVMDVPQAHLVQYPVIIFVKKWRAKIQGFAFGSKQLLLRDIIQQSSENDLEKAKSFISYLIKDLKYPCQDLNLFDASFHSLTDQCIAQYVVYLCNEYQGGRLMKIPEDDKGCEEILLALLSYGWNCWNQKDELIYMMCSWITKKHSILEFMLVNFYNTLDTDGLYSLMVHCCRQVRTRALDAILSYSLLHKEELLMNALIMPVKCAKSRSSFSTTIAQGETFTTSLLGVLFQHGAHACSGFLLQRTVERMSHEKFDSLGVNENG